MNKKEVSLFLGRSTRLVEKYASEGRLGEVTYVRGKTGDQAEYNQDAVVRLKAKLESPDSSPSTTSPEQFYLEDLRGLLSMINVEPRSASVPISEKLLLNITECRLLTGLSNSLLRKAVDAGTLKAKIIGRNYKVKKQDLVEFINNL
jgi:hypothetical protein